MFRRRQAASVGGVVRVTSPPLPRVCDGDPSVLHRCPLGVPSVSPRCPISVPSVSPRCSLGVISVIDVSSVSLSMLSRSSLGVLSEFPLCPSIPLRLPSVFPQFPFGSPLCALDVSSMSQRCPLGAPQCPFEVPRVSSKSPSQSSRL